MSQFFYVHPDNPQKRLITQACELIRDGAVVVYPTDSGYAIGCQIEDKKALDQLCRIRQIDKEHNFTLMCRDMSELSIYANLYSTHRFGTCLSTYTYVAIAAHQEQQNDKPMLQFASNCAK